MRKVIFLPCHPNMWEGFETIWDKETSDPSNQVIVIPIPTYSRSHDDSLYDSEYITSGYPSNLHLLGLDDLDLRSEKPDTIYIQNICDTDNPGFTTHPYFYTSNLRSFTKELVYIPYNCFSEISPEYEQLEKNYLPILAPPGILNVDHIIVQSENMKSVYLNLLAIRSKNSSKNWESKVSFDNYPRKSILKKYSRETVVYPSSWNRHLYDTNGNQRETILYVTSVMGILEFGHEILQKARDIFEQYLDKKDTSTLIWRPNKNLPEIIAKLRPELFNDFRTLLEYYIYNDVGIFDETPTPTPSIILSDYYIGDECGIKELFKSTGKPILS